ncbi:MAG: TonB-dependent receptor [Flavobacteriaceae bacterium]|jgi:iron complex outermembrane receptor protein
MKTIYLGFLAMILPTLSLAQTTAVQDSIPEIQLEEVKLAGLRIDEDQPFSFSNVDKEELASRNLGQDLPIMLNYLPGVVTTSDAGAGIGYTGIRVRGSDATRVNVTINGIPYNDSESQGVYWVNMPDFTSSVSSLQIQRGVGTSTNGSGAFGASINLLTDEVSQKAYAEIANTVGSFNSLKHTLKFSTGLLNNHFEISGRLSKITSDGYVERASSDLKSYFLQAAFQDENTLIKALVFGGHEITYQSWFGVDKNTLASNRRYNPAGEIYDDNGNLEGHYDNQVDNYRQDHYQLHWNQKIDPYTSLSLGFNYTYGRGYYEEYKDLWFEQNINFSSDNNFSFLGLKPVNIGGSTVDTTENIVRKWLDNDYYVATFSLNRQKGNTEWNLGALYSSYVGDHFGELIFAHYAPGVSPRHRFYENQGNKKEGNVYVKVNHRFNDRISGYLDLQYRGISYTAHGNLKGHEPINVDENYGFFNPKAGLVYTLNPNNKFYISFARANREPSRADFENGNPKPEELNDYELGWRFNREKASLLVNFYVMDYTNQLALTGALDDVGTPIRENVGKSSRLGIELEGTFALGNRWTWQPNVTFSRNRNQDFYFQRDGVLTALGDTHLSFSPAVVAGNIIAFQPSPNWKIALLTKHVGDQYMGNIDSETSKLEAYSVSDLNINYRILPKSLFKEINISLLLNNLLGTKYVSNGYFYTFDDDYSIPGTITTVEGAGYYPQAQFNFLAGISLRF